MTDLQKFIKGLQIIQEKEPDTKFDFTTGKFFIADINNYNDEEIEKLEELGFYKDDMYESFEFIH